jgi:hypothetical protein
LKKRPAFPFTGNLKAVRPTLLNEIKEFGVVNFFSRLYIKNLGKQGQSHG